MASRSGLLVGGAPRSPDCRCCQAGQPVARPRVCPECGHRFRGHGWDGIDAHWRAHHEAVLPYAQFWQSLCAWHVA